MLWKNPNFSECCYVVNIVQQTKVRVQVFSATDHAAQFQGVDIIPSGMSSGQAQRVETKIAMNKLFVSTSTYFGVQQATMNEDRMRRSNAKVMRGSEIVDLLEMMMSFVMRADWTRRIP